MKFLHRLVEPANGMYAMFRLTADSDSSSGRESATEVKSWVQ